MFRTIAVTCLALGVTPAWAADAPNLRDGAVFYEVATAFDDVAFGLENAILDQGLVPQETSHVGEMLARTGADVGSDKVIFDQARVMSFCSAALSREAMEADPLNISHCPYTIFVYSLPDRPGGTVVGYRQMPEGPMKKVEALLDRIVRDALDLE